MHLPRPVLRLMSVAGLGVVLTLYLSGCYERDNEYASTNHYVTQGTYTIRAEGGLAGGFNLHSFFVRTATEEFEQAGRIEFIVGGLSRESLPRIKFLLDEARLEYGGRRLSPAQTGTQAVSGTVNPRTGECRFDELRLTFPYEPRLHWGKRIHSRAVRKDVERVPEIRLVVPVLAQDFDPRMDVESRLAPLPLRRREVTFVYTRSEHPGKRRFQFGSW